MDKDSQEVLQKILAKDHSELTQYDIDFLKARRTYLSKADRREYADVLGEDNQEQQPQQPKKQKQNQNNQQQAQNNNANQGQQPQQPSNVETGTGGGGDEDSECLDPDCSNPEHNHEQ